jgi:Uncharacterized protein conserved in bacteria (DUF2314)
MSESQPSRVFMFDDNDPEMQQAYENVRATFRYFWREVARERRRIVPALDLLSFGCLLGLLPRLCHRHRRQRF